MIYWHSIFTSCFLYPRYRIRICIVNFLQLLKLNTFIRGIDSGIVVLCASLVSLELMSANCICGKSNPSALRIVGGKYTKPHEFPWQVVLILGQGQSTFMCGGSLLNDKYVVTAAHCVDNLRATQVSVIFGEHDLSNTKNKYRKVVKAARLIKHPKFRLKGLINDIALVKMVTSISFSDSQRPACLARPGKNFDRVDAVVSGWGQVAEKGSTSKVLKKVNVPLVSLSECRKYFGKNMIFSSMLCGLYKPGGQDSCQGDSGGPLTYRSKDRYYLIGIVSWGVGCARRNSPAIYTRIDKYYSWLDKNTADARSCTN